MKFRISETIYGKFMGISDKIEVAMTAIDDDDAIAIPIKMDNVIHSMKAKNSFKKCGAH